MEIRRCLPLVWFAMLGLPAARAGVTDTNWPFPVGFALRFNSFYKDWQPPSDRSGVSFDTFFLTFHDRWQHWECSSEYRFYRAYSFIHHGWVGYDFSPARRVQVGVQRVPFGILPYASHNYFFQLPYYLGLEDDYDLGLKWQQRAGPWQFTAAWYPRSEPVGFGASVDSARYSYDLVRTRGELADPANPAVTLMRANVERNQLNARLAYTWTSSPRASTQLGLSLQGGQIDNEQLSRSGDRWAAALHLNGNYGRWNVKLEVIRYEFHPKLRRVADDRFVIMGAYDAPYRVAAAGNLYVAGVSYTLPVNLGPFQKLTFYDDYSYLQKEPAGYADTQQNVLGVLITLPKMFIYLDLASGKNHPWLGGNYAGALAEGRPEAGWRTRVNLNFGIYF